MNGADVREPVEATAADDILQRSLSLQDLT